MRRYDGWWVAVIAIVLIPNAMRAESSPNIHGETVEQTAERTGYTADQIQKLFPPVQQWGALGIDPAPDKLADTFARDRFSGPPPAGVHPRVYFGPADLPEIRRRLKETHVGRVHMESLRGRLLQISPKREDWENVPYKPKPEDFASYAEQGRRVEARAGYRGPWVGGWVNELAAGKVPAELEGKWTESPPKVQRQYLMHLLPFEAFRCLVEEDAEGGKRLAAALTTIAGCLRKDMAMWTGTDDWQRIYQLLSSGSVGLTYDWLHPCMTDEQRAAVRSCIVEITRGKQYIGLDHLPAFPGNTSNWNIIHANLLPMVLSIEGEEGYDEAVYRRIVEGLRKWVYVASGPDGAPFEGLIKSTYAPQWLLPLAKRGEPFIGSEWSKNHIRKYHLHVMLPWGGEYVFETGIASPRDVAAFKYAHPTDPVIDLIYAGTIPELFDTEEPHRGYWVNVRTTYAPWWGHMIIAEDPIGVVGGKYDFGKRFDEVMVELAQSEPLAYYSDYRGVMTARSAWNRDAAMLYFEPRNVPGGHTRASRNEFVFASHGRLWATRTDAVEDTSEMHSVVLVDGEGQAKSGGRCPAGRTLAYVDTPQATFAAADAAWAYSYLLVSADCKDAQPVTQKPNDSRLKPSPLPWMDLPWRDLPNWATGLKPAPKKDPGGHGYCIPYNPVKYAYRTCGLVRGEHPYVLIVDDVRKDDAEHDYTWLMQVPTDVSLDRTASSGTDLILKEAEGKRRLLVRVFGDAAMAAAAKLEAYEAGRPDRPKTPCQRLVLPQQGSDGRYRVLLFPHREGETLPETAFDGQTLTIKQSGQTDVFALTAHADGRTRMVLAREGKAVLEVK